MRSFIVGLSLAAIAASAFAADERVASSIVKKYSEAIACQIEETQYKAIKVLPGDKELGGLGAVYVVSWEGDVGCAGGNGTVFPNFTIVEQSGFSSVPPVVMTDYKFPEMELVRLTNISGGNGQLIVSGVT